MPILDKMVKEFDIKLAIHSHGPEDKRFPSPHDVWKAVEPYDKRIGLCIDVGHTARAKVDPADAILKCRARLYDLHLKDLMDTQPKANNVERPRRPGREIHLKALLDIGIPIRSLSNTRRMPTILCLDWQSPWVTSEACWRTFEAISAVASQGSRRNNFTFWRESRWSIMNRFLFAKHAEDRAPSAPHRRSRLASGPGGLQQNANLFLHEPLVVHAQKSRR